MGEERGGGRTQGPGRKRRSEGTRRHHSVPGVVLGAAPEGSVGICRGWPARPPPWTLLLPGLSSL